MLLCIHLVRGRAMSDLDYTLRVHKPEQTGVGVAVYINSPEVPGLHIMGVTAEDALRIIPATVARLRRDNGYPDNGSGNREGA